MTRPIAPSPSSKTWWCTGFGCSSSTTRPQPHTTAAASDEVGAFGLASRAGRALPRRAYDALQVPVDVAVPRTRRRLRVIDARLARAARRAGVEVHAWTIDDPEVAKGLVDLGVD